jgi:probable F420-dependent oxidoreductase
MGEPPRTVAQNRGVYNPAMQPSQPAPHSATDRPRIGATFPQTEFGTDPAAVRDYAQAVEGMGFSHIVAYDHVIGANPNRPGWEGRQRPYSHESPFHEPLVLFAFMAAVTQRVGLVPGVIILPQRQTVLVAKQAAALDVLSGGRLRLGVGVGWNEVEYEALGMDFTNRGVREVEQIRLMRRLWTEPLLTYKGKWHAVTDAGLNPLPVQRPIPVWIGGAQREGNETVLRRIARHADGWILVGPPNDQAEPSWQRIQALAREAGRNPSAIALEGGVRYGDGDLDRMRREYETWRRLGARYVCVNTMGAGFTSPTQHVDALRKAIGTLTS